MCTFVNHTLNRYSYTKQTTIAIILTNGRPTHATPPSYSHRIWSKHYFAVILNNIILSWVDGNFYRTQWQIFGSDKIVSPCLLLSVCWLTMYTKLTRSGFRLIIPIKCTPNTLQQSEHALHCKHQSLCASSWKMLSVRLEFVTFEYVATFFSLIECASHFTLADWKLLHCHFKIVNQLWTLIVSHSIPSFGNRAESKQTGNGHFVGNGLSNYNFDVFLYTLRSVFLADTNEQEKGGETIVGEREKICNIRENYMKKSSICIQYLCARLLASHRLIHISNFLNGKLIIPLYIERVWVSAYMRIEVHSHDRIIPASPLRPSIHIRYRMR